MTEDNEYKEALRQELANVDLEVVKEVKEVKEEVKEVVVEVKEVVTDLQKSLQMIIPEVKKNLITNVIHENLKLSNEAIKIIERLLNSSPTIFGDIEESVRNVVKDGKIDSSDIPSLLAIVRKLYELIYSLKVDKTKRAEITGSILKLSIYLLVSEDKIKVEEERKEEFLSLCDALIDSCITLLSFKKPKKCLKFF